MSGLTLALLAAVCGLAVAYLRAAVTRAEAVAQRDALREQLDAELARREESHTFFQAHAAEHLDAAQRTLASHHERALEAGRAAVAQPLERVLQAVAALDERQRELERGAAARGGRLQEQLHRMVEQHERLAHHTQALEGALRRPQVRGQWGEIQLRNLLEMSGLRAEVDFREQATDAKGRPDVVVAMPGGRSFVIDSKVPLDAYLDAVSISDPDAQREQLRRHAKAVRHHVRELAGRDYTDARHGVDFVALHLPSEAVFAEALAADPELFDYAIGQEVFITSPSTLLALLKAVAYGWQQEEVSQHAGEIAALGRELAERLRTVHDHWDQVGTQLERVVKAYNGAVGSWESRLMVTARKFPALGIGEREGTPALLEPVETQPRSLPVPDPGD